jgi:hypothetical protein
MAAEEDDLAQLEAVLRERGFGSIVAELNAETGVDQGSTQLRFELLLEVLGAAVVPAVRARASATRMLSEVEHVSERMDVEDEVGEGDVGAFRVATDPGAAERLENEADRLEGLIAALRDRVRADQG